MLMAKQANSVLHTCLNDSGDSVSQAAYNMLHVPFVLQHPTPAATGRPDPAAHPVLVVEVLIGTLADCSTKTGWAA